MTNGEQPLNTTDGPIDEKAFADYLREHPDFFQRHASLLAGLVIPHPHSGQAVSLLERQVMVMREQQDETQKKLRELVNNARNNEKLHKGMEDLAIEMISLDSIESFRKKVPASLKALFELDYISLQTDAASLSKVKSKNNEPFCSTELDSIVLTKIFGDDARHIKSAAIIPLNAPVVALIAFGATDKKRYGNDSGTRYLSQLQRFLNASLHRLNQSTGN
jgi:uncharacterized protein